MKQLAFIFTFYISTIGVSLAQLSPEKETLLDSIFQEWN